MWKKALTSPLLVVMVCLSLLAGCGSPYKPVRLLPTDLFEEKSKNAVNSDSPSRQTRQTLRLMFLDKDYKKDSSQVIAVLEEKVKQKPNSGLRIALGELSLLEAQKHQKTDSQKAVVYYLMAAQQSYDGLFFDDRETIDSPLSPSFRLMADIYNVALTRIISLRANRQDKWDSKEFDFEGVRYRFEVVKEGQGIWDPSWFNYLYSAYEVRVRGLTNEYISNGLGAPLVGIVEKPQQHPNFGPFYPPQMLSYPVSALLLFDPVTGTNPPTRAIRLVFYDGFHTDSVEIQGRSVPLEVDFTTPLGLQLQKANPLKIGLYRLFNSDIELQNAGVYLMEPYQPDKIPVVMVHGLMSSPLTWAGMFNDLRGDPELRKNYQFMFFMYPTGLPIGYSASILREQLNALRTRFDPTGSNPCFNQMVLIGHSMGGLLSRAMVQDSGTRYWDFFFDEPFETIDLDAQTKEALKKIAFFEHLPYVKRVIFIATPHRGSPMADHWYTRLAAGMVDLPATISTVTASIVSRDILTESVSQEYMKKTRNSLTLLSPSSSFMRAINTVPMRDDIPYHSIIGTRKPVAKGDGTSDGIVPYESSHIDVAQSEVLVPSGHGAHTHPLAIAEVKRILYEHLERQP